MKKIEAIIRSDRLPDVKDMLKTLGISGMTVYSVSGWSKGKEENLQWKGQTVVHDLIAKSKLEILIADEEVDRLVEAIGKHARTGVHGDGIIFVLPVEQAINITSMDKNEKVI